MRRPDQLVHSRARVRPRYALLPLEGFPTSRIPSWPSCEARVLAAPALGARFVQYLFDIPAGKGTGQGLALDEAFGYLISGSIDVTVRGQRATLQPGGFFFAPENAEWTLRATQASQLLLLRKRFEPSGLHRAAEPAPLIGDAAAVPALPYMDNPHARLQTLIPDELQYDLAMNIFTFDPGHGLPYVETHVMEHGLLVLQGKGMYYLNGEWMEVEKDDFIWMGPYCPQSFYATGPTAAKYIYYKNVNREIPL